jgi:hypothetical protein
MKIKKKTNATPRGMSENIQRWISFSSRFESSMLSTLSVRRMATPFLYVGTVITVVQTLELSTRAKPGIILSLLSAESV